MSAALDLDRVRPENAAPEDAFDVHPGLKLKGRVEGVYLADGATFRTREVDTLDFAFSGIPNDRHHGATRPSGALEPWYERGTEMKNERQVTILSAEDMQGVADSLSIPRLLPEWIGGNILVSGIPHFSYLPSRSILLFEGGVSIRVDGDNPPCRNSGRSIAGEFEGRDDIEFGFPKMAVRRRGLLTWVEKPGTIEKGEAFTVRVFPQWTYDPKR